MTISVCFYAEAKGSCGRQIRLYDWDTLGHFGVEELLVVDRTGFECFNPKTKIPLTKFDSLAEALDRNAHAVFADASMPDAIPYGEYLHPAGDVIYCFGSDVGGFRGEAQEGRGDWISIPGDSKYELWAIQAASIVMSNRWLRGNH
jgi:hypothetical protein